MHRLMVFMLSAWVCLASALPAYAVQVVNKPSDPVYVVNLDVFFYAMIGVGAVGILVLALVWVQLGSIRAALEKGNGPR